MQRLSSFPDAPPERDGHRDVEEEEDDDGHHEEDERRQLMNRVPLQRRMVVLKSCHKSNFGGSTSGVLHMAHMADSSRSTPLDGSATASVISVKSR